MHVTKELPILFSGPMVRAILRGDKTQTRRIINPQPEFKNWEREPSSGVVNEAWQTGFVKIRCPYGSSGSHLWVRETHMVWTGGAAGTTELLYRDDPEWDLAIKDRDEIRKARSRTEIDPVVGNYKIVPSIHMPRWRSRIALELLQVRVERLQEITEDDALAEGVAASEPITQVDIEALADGTMEKALAEAFGTGGHFTAKFNYSMLWDGINRKRAAWATNPWVWVLSFKRVEAKS